MAGKKIWLIFGLAELLWYAAQPNYRDSKNMTKIRLTTNIFGWNRPIWLKYCTRHNKLEKNCHCQSTTVMNKADKCSAVCIKHTWAAVSSVQQQISSTPQVRNLCKPKPVMSCTKKTQAELLADENSAANAVNGAGLGSPTAWIELDLLAPLLIKRHSHNNQLVPHKL